MKCPLPSTSCDDDLQNDKQEIYQHLKDAHGIPKCPNCNVIGLYDYNQAIGHLKRCFVEKCAIKNCCATFLHKSRIEHYTTYHGYPCCAKCSLVLCDIHLWVQHNEQDTHETVIKRKKISNTLRNKIAEKQLRCCNLCKNLLLPSFEIDHIEALQFGGNNEMDNLQALCRCCHGEKTRIENIKNLDF